MEAIIEFILSNFVIVLLILGVLSRLFGGAKEEEQKRQKNTRQGRPASGQQRPRPVPSQTRRESDQPVQGMPNTGSSTPVPSVSVESEQQKQLEQLAAQMKTEGKQSFEDLAAQISQEERPTIQVENKQQASINHTEMQREIKRGITKKSLVHSVIMAEVLGPPRARKPYKSIIDERRQ